ncbi:hypothetical protein FRC07_010135 [Ceratobasidium sp. 392]|nr:hypothetical protein FRC07_010135 [Ceratobasidium sp. 392]
MDSPATTSVSTRQHQNALSAAFPKHPEASEGQGSVESMPEIKYAVIGYGAGGGQFVGDLILERLILHWMNKRAANKLKDFKYRLHITVFSSQGADEAGGGEAWSSDQDGCINSPIPGHPDMPEEDKLPQTLHYQRLNSLVTDLVSETSKTVWHDFDNLMDHFEEVNKPAAALMWERSQQDGKLDTSRACVPRSVLGNVRKKGLQGIIKFAHKYFPSITVDVKYATRAVLHDITNPERPVVAYFPPKESQKTEVFDKVVNFSGSRITSIVKPEVQSLVHSNPINNRDVKAYLEMRGCGDPTQGKVIGFGGVQLNFIDCTSIVGTLRGCFEFNRDKRPFCSPTTLPLNDKFIVFTRREGGSIKPRLSFTQNWPHPDSYLETEHVLALRTQKGFDWVTTIQVIWESMISYVMNVHPNEYAPKNSTTMSGQWKLYSNECKTFRANESTPTYCGLERILIDALFDGYGAEPSVGDAKERMMKAFPAVFVCGERISAAFYAHVSSIAFLDAHRESNSGIQDILREWYRTLASSPIELCEPIFELHEKGVLVHKIGDVTEIEVDELENKIIIGGEKVDALLAPGPFGKGLDDVINSEPICSKLKMQAPGIPTWKALGQLVDKDDRLLNVWDQSNNRGVGLVYGHLNKVGEKVESEVISRSVVNQLSATHEFAPSLAACLLAHDLYFIGKGHHKTAPSERLYQAIEDQQPKFNDYSLQMNGLEQPYVESMKRFYFLQAIRSEGNPKTWREHYKNGRTEEDRKKVIDKMLNSKVKVLREAANAYQANVNEINRDAMDYDEWHTPFTDIEMPKAWEILDNANSWYLKHYDAV